MDFGNGLRRESCVRQGIEGGRVGEGEEPSAKAELKV
jgi:hypothetical protein